MPDANPFAQYLPQATPKAAPPPGPSPAPPPPPPSLFDRAGEVVSAGIDAYREQYHEERLESDAEIGGAVGQFDPTQAEKVYKETLARTGDERQARDAMGAEFAAHLVTQAAPAGTVGQVLLDVFNRGLIPATALLDAWNKATLGKTTGIPAETLSNDELALTGVADAAAAERALITGSREMGMSIEAYVRHLAIRQANAQAVRLSGQAAANAAAKRILEKGVGQGAVDPVAVRESVAEHARVGAGRPTLLDTMQRRGQRLVRSAGAKMGDADQILGEHREAVREDVSARASQRVRKETQYRQSVAQRIAKLKAEQEDLAHTTYRELYAQPVKADERLFQVLDSRPGIRALASARQTAQVRMLDDPEAARQFHEMGALQHYFVDQAKYEQDLADWKLSGGGQYATPPTPKAKALLDDPQTAKRVTDALKAEFGWKSTPMPQPPEIPQISAGTIDRIRIQMDHMAEGLKEKRSTYALGVATKGRAEALDAYLDDLPQLQPARAPYKDYAKRIEQLEFDGNLSTMDPRDFADTLKELTPQQRQELVHNIAERLAGNLGRSARGEQAQSDILATGYNFRENLRALLGPETADRYLKAMKLIGQGLKNATFVDPSVGSRTAPMTEDIASTSGHIALQLASGHHYGAMRKAMDFVLRNLTGMSDAEARQIADWAVSRDDVEDTLQTIIAAAKPGIAGRRAAQKLPSSVGPLLAAYAISRPTGQATLDKDTDADPTVPAPDSSAPPVDPNNPFAKYVGAPTGQTSAAPPPPSGSDMPASPDQEAKVSGLLDTVRKLEGSGDDAVSPKGAVGRYQIWPPTAEHYGIDVNRLTDPEYAKAAATKILTDLVQRYGDDEAAILVAYNGGPERADEWLAAGRNPAVLRPETQKYLVRAGLLDPSQVVAGSAASGPPSDGSGSLSSFSFPVAPQNAEQALTVP